MAAPAVELSERCEAWQVNSRFKAIYGGAAVSARESKIDGYLLHMYTKDGMLDFTIGLLFKSEP